MTAYSGKMETAIQVQNLSKVFIDKKTDREIWAVDDLSFNVYKGEIFGLLGPNGAGKTTSIRLISGILKPTTGTAYIYNEDIMQKGPILRKDMGFLMENHGSYENLSLYENLDFFGRFYGLPDLDTRISAVLKEMGLLERRNMKAGKLSKGQKQRLALARTILHEPKMLFFDEPTSGLDPKASVKVRELILSLKRKNRTIFINSHNLEEVQKICDRVAILDEGKIKRIGTPAELSGELWDTQETICTLSGAVSPQIEKAIAGLEYIKQYRVENNEIYLYSEDANVTTPLIVKKLVELGAQILEVNRTVHSLEDIYLKLMEDEE